MLLFIGPEPNAENEKDGMTQRVRWIDEQFADTPRVILHIRLKKGWKKSRHVRSPFLTVEEMNFLHVFRILSLALHSDGIYVHSCYNALKSLPVYFLGVPVITDLHGVVPEELRDEGRPIVSGWMSLIERLVIWRSKALVFVTDTMRRHFLKKYRGMHSKGSYVIPILPEQPMLEKQSRNPRLVIYAGGTQPWQNVEKMGEVAAQTQGQFHYIFLTGRIGEFTRKLHAEGLTDIQVDSVPKSRVFDYYQRASFGLILREDSLVNRVACPTKMVEYLWAGVIPIVEMPHVGDFEAVGYRYILRKDFVNLSIPDRSELEAMRSTNQGVIASLRDLGMQELTRLKADVA
jgi:glycosyltransferase involved in cell wall biosynthesis